MNTILKRVIALVLCFVMTVGYVPVSAFATEADETVTTETTEVTTEETGESSEGTEASSETPAVLAALLDEIKGSDKAEKESEEEAKKPEKPGKPGEATEPSTEATEPSTEATEPSTEATEPSTEATEPSTEATVPVTEETVPETTEAVVTDELLANLNDWLTTLNGGIMAKAETAAEALEALENAELSTDTLKDAQDFIDALTINNTSNDPATVVKNFGTHFTWDNEDRENSASYLYDWSYYNGVVFEGLEYLYEVTGKQVYKDYVVEYMSSLINAEGTWATCTNNTSKQCAGYNATHGADCYKTASLLLDLYEMTKDERYLTMAATLYADLDTAALSYSLKNAGNNYRHTWASDSNPDLWLDGLYMILPFRAEYAKHIGDTEELNLIVSRMQWVSDNMYNSTKKLFYHAADSATSNSGTYWLRAIGWYAAAIVDIMDSMSGSNLESMKAQLVKLVDGMKACQNTSNGMWLNNMNASQSSTNPYETSGTALVCYAVMKAVNNGWLDKSYADMAILAFNGICSEKLSGTTLKDICFKGAPNAGNSTFYDNEGKGVGPFIMLYAEILEYTGVKPEQPDVTEPTDPSEPSEPAEPEEVTKEDTATGVSVTAPGITGLTVSKIEDTAQVEQIQQKLAQILKTENLVMLDISVADFVAGSTATVLVPIPEGMDHTKFAVYYVPEEGEPERMPGKVLSETEYEFTTTHFSDYVGGERAITSGESSDSGVLETVTGVIEAQENVTEITSGAYYQLIVKRHNNYLTGTVSGNRLVQTNENTNYYWYITKAGEGTYYVQYGGPDGDYLTVGQGTAGLSSTPTALTLNYVNSVSSWEIQSGNQYLNDYNQAGEFVSGWTAGAASDAGSRWQLNRVASKTYVLDTDGMDAGENNKYIVVGNTEAKALTLLTNVSAGNVNIGSTDVVITDNGNYATVIGGNTNDYEFHFADNSSKESGTYLLTKNNDWTVKHTNGNLYYVAPQDGTYHRGYWYVASLNNGQYRVYDRDNHNWHLNYGRSSSNTDIAGFSVNTSENETVRLYRPMTATTGGTVGFKLAPTTVELQPKESSYLTGTVTVNGETVELSNCTIDWSTSNPSYVTVNNGTITGHNDTPANTPATVTATLKAVNGVSLANPISLTAAVTVKTPTITKVELVPKSGTVYKGAGAGANTRAKIVTTYDNGTFKEEYVYLSMVTAGTYNTNVVGDYPNLTVSDGTNTFTDFTLHVVEKQDMNYPDYPDPGSVMIDKFVADASQFQSAGVAEINLVAAGLPAHVGVDVILVSDLSNSMAWDLTRSSNSKDADRAADSYETTKLHDLQEAVSEFAEGFLKNDDGTANDNTISLVTFGGYDAQHTNKQISGYADPTRTLLVGSRSISEVQDTINDIRIIREGKVNANGTDSAPYSDSSTDYWLSFDGGSNWGANYGNTNYDYAFMETYNAVKALKDQYVASTKEEYDQSGRSIYILFMTDGAPTNYDGKYFQEQTNTDRADVNATWLPSVGATKATYDMLDHEDDVKGWYKVIAGGDYDTANKTIPGNPMYWATQVYNMSGVEEMFSIGFDIQNGGFKGMSFTLAQGCPLDKVLEKLVEGEELDVYEASSPEDLQEIYAKLASELKLAAQNAFFFDQMGDSFNIQMASTVTKYDKDTAVPTETITLTPRPKITIRTQNIYTPDDVNGTTVTSAMIGQPVPNTMQVAEVVIFNNDGTKAYSNQIDLNGNGTKGYTESNGSYTIDEGDNIINSNGVIVGKNFWYNTSKSAQNITLANGSTYSLPAETFYWNIGTIDNQEFIMSYYVYLAGSAEGQAKAGTYATNNKAVLSYTNWLGNDAEQEVDSPVLAWEKASVYYRFYLVDKNGNTIVNRATGETGDFSQRIHVTPRIFYQDILLNTVTEGNSATIHLDNSAVLPEGYTLYDPDANFAIVINSEAEYSYWNIGHGAGKAAATYITDYYGNEYSNASTSKGMYENGWDLTSTTVWFPVLWEPAALPDTVVIDYGLPVDINVLDNDMFGNYANLTGLGETNPVRRADDAANEISDVDVYKRFRTAHDTSFTTDDLTQDYGKAAIVNQKVRYTPSNMQMPGYDKFVYEALYNHPTAGAQYYYGEVTVIPATTIYYEDNFVTYSAKEWKNNGWSNAAVGTVWSFDTNDAEIQAEDRPGKISLNDANNIYGYDGVNLKMSTYSLNGHAKANVDYDKLGLAEFDFYGTGFDVISMTDNTTGTIIVKAFPYGEKGISDTPLANFVVDTYYGYKATYYKTVFTYQDDEWKVTSRTIVTEPEYNTNQSEQKPADPKIDNSYFIYEIDWEPVEKQDNANSDKIYQVPVMQITNLPYQKYRAQITVIWDPIFEHNTAKDENGASSSSYDFYLDAIRIYDPANDGASDGSTDTTIEDAYVADGEGWPTYLELRDHIIDKSSFADGSLPASQKFDGMVFIDGDAAVGDAELAKYTNFGPNNEIYLASGQRVAFILNPAAKAPEGKVVDQVHIGVKSANGAPASVTFTNVNQTSGKYYNVRTRVVDTTTDMYYDLTPWVNDIIVISNYTQDTATTGILSITNIKITFKNANNTTDGETGNETDDDEDNNTPPIEGNGGTESTSVMYMTPMAANMTLKALNSAYVTAPEIEPSTPETEPEATEPEWDETDEDTEQFRKVLEKTMMEAQKAAQNAFTEAWKAAEKAAKEVAKLLDKWF